jgi:signal transduction histidine kinase
VLNDILDLTKIEAGRMDLELQPFDLADTVQDVVSLLAVRASRLGRAGCGGRGGCRNKPALALGGARALRPPSLAGEL